MIWSPLVPQTPLLIERACVNAARNCRVVLYWSASGVCALHAQPLHLSPSVLLFQPSNSGTSSLACVHPCTTLTVRYKALSCFHRKQSTTGSIFLGDITVPQISWVKATT